MASHNPVLAAKAPDAVLGKLVDPRKGCTAVYSLYLHDQLGFLLGAFMIEHTQAGGLSLRAQRLLPENIEQFAAVLGETDRELVKILGEITLQQLFKKFGKDISSLQLFLKKYADAPYKEYLSKYIAQRMLDALVLLPGKPLYAMSKDGYPAGKPLTVSAEPAQVNFHFSKAPAHTAYRVTINLGGGTVPLHAQPGGVLTDDPVWLLSGTTLFRLADPVEGKKLKPFFAKDTILIPIEREKEYYEKFLLRLLEYNTVHTDGIWVRQVREQPEGRVILESENDTRVRFRLQVRYGGLEVVPGEGKQASVEMRVEKNGHNGNGTRSNGSEAYVFTRTARDRARELHWKELFEGMRPVGQLVDPSYTLPEAYDWLVKNYENLITEGLVLVQQQEGPRLHVGVPSIQWASAAVDLGFSVKPEVRSQGQPVPFKAVREAIIKYKREIDLTDGSRIYLPEAWLDEYRHLIEVAQWDEAAGALMLGPAHAGLLPEGAANLKRGNDAAFSLAAFEQIQTQQLPKGLHATLRDYQHAGYDWLCFLRDYNLGGILADDMGLGKTLQTLAFLLQEKEKGIKQPNLVVVPNSLLYNWVAEAEKFAPSLRVQVYTGTKQTRSERSLFNYDVLLTTYGMVRQDIERFLPVQFHAIVLDESQYIKNRDAKTTQAVLKLQGRIKLSLSGTPIENSTLDLWSQMQFVCPGLLGSESFFERYYAIPIEKENNMARADRLRKLIKPLVLRRTKEQVASELPPLVEQIQYCAMTPDQSALYESVREELRKTYFAKTDEGTVEKSKIQILAALQRLRQVAIHPGLLRDENGMPLPGDSGKYDAIWTILRDILAQGRKVLVFSQFVKFLTILRNDLDKEGIPYSYLDGGLDASERADEIAAFQKDGDRQIFLISLKAGGVGLNLTAAEYVLIVDPWWNPAVERQALSRAHRIGQKQTVFASKFITQGSIEEKILKLQEAKEKLAGEIIRSEEQFFKNLTVEDLRALFE